MQQVWIKYQPCNLCWQGSTYAAGEEGAASVPSCIDWVFKRVASNVCRWCGLFISCCGTAWLSLSTTVHAEAVTVSSCQWRSPDEECVCLVPLVQGIQWRGQFRVNTWTKSTKIWARKDGEFMMEMLIQIIFLTDWSQMTGLATFTVTVRYNIFQIYCVAEPNYELCHVHQRHQKNSRNFQR